MARSARNLKVRSRKLAPVQQVATQGIAVVLMATALRAKWRECYEDVGKRAVARTVLDYEAERSHAAVAKHERVQEARLLHGELVADGHVTLQLRRGMLQLQDRHARLQDRLDQRELTRRLERLEGLREVTDERLLLSVPWRWARGQQREVEICAWLGFRVRALGLGLGSGSG